MLKPGFIDLSHHNTVPKSLHEAHLAGVQGVIHKASEGTSYVDTKLAARHHLTKDAGMLWGMYHFVRPGDMRAQAKHFLQTGSPFADPNTLWCLDWEVEGLTIDDVLEFLEAIWGETGHHPVLYSGHTVKDALHGKPSAPLSEYRLWLAHYTSAKAPTLPPGWTKYWGWQYTDQGNVPGVDSPVDMNAYDGNVPDLIGDWSRSDYVPDDDDAVVA